MLTTAWSTKKFLALDKLLQFCVIYFIKCEVSYDNTFLSAERSCFFFRRGDLWYSVYGKYIIPIAYIEQLTHGICCCFPVSPNHTVSYLTTRTTLFTLFISIISTVGPGPNSQKMLISDYWIQGRFNCIKRAYDNTWVYFTQQIT